MRRTATIAVAVALAAAASCFVATADAMPPQPVDLQVVGGNGWHPENSLQVTWSSPATPLASVHYRVRDALGTQVAAAELGWAADGIGPLVVPRVPGVYTAEVWFEDAFGEEGAAATTVFRFDDSRPAATTLPTIPGWIGRTAFPLTIRLGHPPGPAPLAGIRGYAVAIDSLPGGAPCAAADRCSEAETTLRGGPDDDALAIAMLPEGVRYLHAATVSGSGMKSVTNAHATLHVDTTDPLTQLSGVPNGWSNRAVKLIAAATDAGAGMDPDGFGPPPVTAIRVDGGTPVVAQGRSAAVSVIGEGAHTVAYYARDAAGNSDDGGASNGVPNRQPRTALVRIDRGQPEVAFTNSQLRHDPELIRVRVGDSLSGADLSRGWIGIRVAGSGDPFEKLPASSPVGDELRVRWDSDAYPTGRYELRAIGYDLAGNGAVTTRRANGTTMILTNPLKVTTVLRANWAARTVAYGRGFRLSGRLISVPGAPLAGMPVRIVERFADGSGRATLASIVKTGPGGTFSTDLAAGPSREVTTIFDGSPTLSRSVGRPVHLHVRSRVWLRRSVPVAAVGGAPVVFRGRVAAPRGTIPTGGVSVQLQFRLPGLRWTEFRTIQTDRHGRFRYAYRFSDDDSRGVRFQFRAYAPAQGGWPYEPGGSAPVAVRGR